MKTICILTSVLLLMPGLVFSASLEESSGVQKKSDSSNQYRIGVLKPKCVPGECICSGRVSPEGFHALRRILTAMDLQILPFAVAKDWPLL